jgi:hypothetical protein
MGVFLYFTDSGENDARLREGDADFGSEKVGKIGEVRRGITVKCGGDVFCVVLNETQSSLFTN